MASCTTARESSPPLPKTRNLSCDQLWQLVDWSAQNVLAVGLGTCVYLWSACTSKVTKLCDLGSSEPQDSVCSVAWSQRGTYLSVGTNNGETQLWDVAKIKLIRIMQVSMLLLIPLCVCFPSPKEEETVRTAASALNSVADDSGQLCNVGRCTASAANLGLICEWIVRVANVPHLSICAFQSFLKPSLPSRACSPCRNRDCKS